MARSSRDMMNTILQWVARSNCSYPISLSDPSGMQIGAFSLTKTESWLNQTGWHWQHLAEVALYKACSKCYFLVVQWNKSRGHLQESFQNSSRQWLWKRHCNISTLLLCAKHGETGRINIDGRRNAQVSSRCLNIWCHFANLSGRNILGFVCYFWLQMRYWILKCLCKKKSL